MVSWFPMWRIVGLVMVVVATISVPTPASRRRLAIVSAIGLVCSVVPLACGGTASPPPRRGTQDCSPRPTTEKLSPALAKQIENVCSEVASSGLQLHLFVGGGVRAATGPPQCPTIASAVLQTINPDNIRADGYFRIAFYPTRQEQVHCYQVWRAWALRYSRAVTTAGSDEAEGAPFGAVDIYVRANTVPPI